LILLVPYALAFTLVVFEMRGALPSRGLRTPPLPPWIWVAGIVSSYTVQLALVWFGATHATPLPDWRLHMPLPVLFTGTADIDAVSAVFLAAGALQSYAMLALYRSRPSRRLVFAGFGMLAALSITAPALASFDSYLYARASVIGTLAWAPPASASAGEYHVVDLWFRKTGGAYLPYGPLWICIVRIVCALPQSILCKVVTLRASGALLVVALIASMRAAGLPRRLLVVAGLNPAIMFEFVANAHNDIIPVVILTIASAIMQRHRVAAFGLLAVAGLVKLPYLALGLPIFARVSPPLRRYLGCALAVAGSLTLSWFGGGETYLHALRGHATASRHQDILHLIPVACALVVLGIALAGGRRLISAVWLFPAIGAVGIPLIFPWYAIWGFPYAIARHRIIGALLVLFPFATALMLPEFMRLWTLFVVFPLVVALSYRPPDRFLQSFASLRLNALGNRDAQAAGLEIPG
jgi:hypothetical protein